jgi:hypothetical protein
VVLALRHSSRSYVEAGRRRLGPLWFPPWFQASRLDASRRPLWAKPSARIDRSGGNNCARFFRVFSFLRTISAALVEVRKAGLSSQVTDVSVCGAVAPYSALLGGKLVALLMTSQEVRDAYRSRYAGQVSLISSQMAGRPIFRPAELKILTTTSLYGNGSSQYNRLRLRREEFPQLENDVAWQELAQTAGYGTVHLRASTVQVLREYSERTYGARRINNRFGEGASPRLRQIREAMDALGVDSASVLHHATPRIFYGCELHPGAREELLGFSPMTESKGHTASVIASLWRERWLMGRVRNGQVLERVAATNAESVATFFAEAQRIETEATRDGDEARDDAIAG